jgi:hypothetical protein
LARALAVARDAYPRDAARAQADWDCWRLDLKVSSQAASADKCRQSFEITLPRLEAEASAVAAENAKRDAEKKKSAETRPEGDADSANP